MNEINWDYRSNNGVNMWFCNPAAGVRYLVTQQADNIQAHITTGETHKYSRTIGSYATVSEARQRCMDHWQGSCYT